MKFICKNWGACYIQLSICPFLDVSDAYGKGGRWPWRAAHSIGQIHVIQLFGQALVAFYWFPSSPSSLLSLPLACLRSTWQYITQVLSMSSGDPVLSPSEDSFCTATSTFLESLYDERNLYFHFGYEVLLFPSPSPFLSPSRNTLVVWIPMYISNSYVRLVRSISYIHLVFSVNWVDYSYIWIVLIVVFQVWTIWYERSK